VTLEYARESTEKPPSNHHSSHHSNHSGDSTHGPGQSYPYRGREREDRDGGGRGGGGSQAAGLDWICSSVSAFEHGLLSILFSNTLYEHLSGFCLFLIRISSARVTTSPDVESATVAVPSAHPLVQLCRVAAVLRRYQTLAIEIPCARMIWYEFFLLPVFISLGQDCGCLEKRECGNLPLLERLPPCFLFHFMFFAGKCDARCPSASTWVESISGRAICT